MNRIFKDTYHFVSVTCARSDRTKSNDIGCAANIGSVDSLTLSPINWPLWSYKANEKTYFKSGSRPEIFKGFVKLPGIYFFLDKKFSKITSKKISVFYLLTRSWIYRISHSRLCIRAISCTTKYPICRNLKWSSSKNNSNLNFYKLYSPSDQNLVPWQIQMLELVR